MGKSVFVLKETEFGRKYFKPLFENKHRCKVLCKKGKKCSSIKEYTFFYKNSVTRTQGSFCSQFKNKLRTMPAASVTKNNIKNQNKKKIKSKKILNSVLTQSDEIRMIFWHLRAKLQQFWDYRELLRTARATISFLALAVWKCSHSQFYDAAKAAEKAFTQADRKSIGSKTVLQTWSP